MLCYAKPLQSCPTLCDPMGCSPLGSSVHGILQTIILQRVAMPSSRDMNLEPAGNKHKCSFTHNNIYEGTKTTKTLFQMKLS